MKSARIHACKQHFWGTYSKSTFNAVDLCRSPFTCSCEKGKSLNDFKFGTSNGRFSSGGEARTAVKGLNTLAATRYSQNWRVEERLKVDAFNFATRELPFSCLLHSSPNGGRSLAGGCSSSVWNVTCCIWNRQTETDGLNCFDRTAVPTRDPLETRCGRSFSPTWLNGGACISVFMVELAVSDISGRYVSFTWITICLLLCCCDAKRLPATAHGSFQFKSEQRPNRFFLTKWPNKFFFTGLLVVFSLRELTCMHRLYLALWTRKVLSGSFILFLFFKRHVI